MAETQTTQRTGQAQAPHPTNGTTKHDPNRVMLIDQKDVFVPHAWNGRNAGSDPNHPLYAVYIPADAGNLVAPGAGLTDEEGSGSEGDTAFAGLCKSIEHKGQDTPVTVRPTPPEMAKEAGRKPWTLTVGFRRFAALQLLHEQGSAIPNVPKGQIQALVREESEADALARNARENTGRESLAAPDLALLCGRLQKMGLSGVAIADQTNRAKSYVSRMLAVVTGCKPKLLHAWRNGQNLAGKQTRKRVTVDVMQKIAEMATEDEQSAAYNKACESIVVQDEGQAHRGNAWEVSATKKAEAVGATLGTIAFHDPSGDVLARGKKLEKFLTDHIEDFVTIKPPTHKKQKKSAWLKVKEKATIRIGQKLFAAYVARVEALKAAEEAAEAEGEEEDEEEGEEGE